MSSWDRNTKWHQGSILLVEQNISLKTQFPQLKDADFIVAISHDCDIAQEDLDKEPNVEFIAGNFIQLNEVNGNLTFAKNPRTLQLTFFSVDQQKKCIQLKATDKFLMPKNSLQKYKPDYNFLLDAEQKNILQDWLSVRYRRHAFPDKFNERFSSVEKILKKEGGKYSADIIAYYLDYDPKNTELLPGEPYECSISIVYSVDILSARENAERVAKKILEKRDYFFEMGIDLRSCEVFSESEFTLFDMRRHIMYVADYLSYEK